MFDDGVMVMQNAVGRGLLRANGTLALYREGEDECCFPVCGVCQPGTSPAGFSVEVLSLWECGCHAAERRTWLSMFVTCTNLVYSNVNRCVWASPAVPIMLTENYEFAPCAGNVYLSGTYTIPWNVWLSRNGAYMELSVGISWPAPALPFWWSEGVNLGLGSQVNCSNIDRTLPNSSNSNFYCMPTSVRVRSITSTLAGAGDGLADARRGVCQTCEHANPVGVCELRWPDGLCLANWMAWLTAPASACPLGRWSAIGGT